MTDEDRIRDCFLLWLRVLELAEGGNPDPKEWWNRVNHFNRVYNRLDFTLQPEVNAMVCEYFKTK